MKKHTNKTVSDNTPNITIILYLTTKTRTKQRHCKYANNNYSCIRHNKHLK